MSQAGIINTSSGPVPPAVPTSFVTDDGTAIPALNILNVLGVDSTENNDNGILTRANPNLSNNLDVVLSNRITGTVTTIDATPTIISTFPLGATPGVYTFDVQIAGYDVTDTAGIGYFIEGSIRTTGAAGVVIGTPDKVINEEAATVTCDANLIVSGNNAIVQVTGIAGKTINWRVLSIYIFVS